MSKGPGSEPGGGSPPLREPRRLLVAIGIVVGTALFVLAWSWTGPLAVILLVLFTIAMVVGASFMAIRSRDSQRYALLWLLAIAADHRMPLANSVEAFAGQYRGDFRRRVVRLAALLAEGSGLSAALRKVAGLTSAETAMMVEVGEENDRLGESLRMAAAQQSERSAASQELAAQMSYLGIVLLIGQGIVFFVLYFIMPKFKAIFADFGIPLPPVTEFVIWWADLLSRYAMIFPLLTVTAAVVLLVTPWLSADGAASWLPGGWPRRRHAAVILRALAMTAEARRPIESGLHTLALRHPSRWVRGRVAAAEADVARGVDWREALHRRGLIRPTELEALRAAQAVGNLPWAMNDLADSALRRANVRRTMLAQALWPLIVGAVGAVVLLLAVAFFLPLIELIGRLSG